MKRLFDGKTVLLLFVVSCIIIVPRLPFLNDYYYNVDEGTGATVANVLKDGGVLYRDVVDTRPPVASLVYLLIFSIFGRGNMAAVHGGLLVLLVVVSLFLYALGRTMDKPLTGIFACALFSIASFNYVSWDVLAFHTEWLLIFFTSLATIFLCRGVERQNVPCLFFGGTAYGLALFSKQPAAADFFCAVLFLATVFILLKRDRRFFLKAVLALTAGFSLILLAVTAYFAKQGVLKDFWFCVFEYNIRYHVGMMPWRYRLAAFATNLVGPGVYLSDNAIVTMLAFGYVFWFGCRLIMENQKPFDFENIFREKKNLFGLFLVIWILGSYAGTCLSGRGEGWGHYFFQILPPFCLAGGIVLSRAQGALAARLQNASWFRFGCGRSRFWPNAPKLAVALVFFFTLAFYPFINFILVPPSVELEWKLFPWVVPPSTIRGLANLDPEASMDAQAVNYLRRYSRAGDRLFVWGFMPEFYARSGLSPASRFIYCLHLTGLIPWINRDPSVDTRDKIVPGSWDILMRDLESSRPKFILNTSVNPKIVFAKYPIDQYEPLDRFVKRYYTVDINFEKTFTGAYRLYRRADSK